MNTDKKEKNWRHRLHEVIYGTDTPAGKLFDVILLIVIVLSIIVVMLESTPKISEKYYNALNITEWIITFLFPIEYILRIICINKPVKYIFSFFGIIDFLSTIPKYVSLFFGGTQFLTAVRVLRLLRIFRILKLVRFIGESNNLLRALNASKTKIFVFVFFIIVISILLGTIMYIIEGPENGFNSIPHSVYWTIVTLTTVGYGDISPQTDLGQLFATIIMIIGYGVIAVPTGIVSAEYSAAKKQPDNDKGRACPNCGTDILKSDANYCRKCGYKLEED